MKTFIQVVEIWVPAADGQLLELGGGLYGEAPEFGAISRSMCFGRGEGLPGRVWEEGAPIVLKDLQGGFFQRAAAAKAAGLTCAAAFPVFYRDTLKAIVVLFCGEAAGQSGAIEVWRNDPRVSTDLQLLDGVYGAMDVAFENASRQTYLSRGTGLPGIAWQNQASVLMDALSDSSQFVRAGNAAETGLRQGFATLCPVPTNEVYVLAFLSSPAMPIATRIERWLPDSGLSLKLAAAFGEHAEVSATGVDPLVLEAFAGALPMVRQKGASDRTPSLLALPVISDGVVVEAVAMYF